MGTSSRQNLFFFFARTKMASSSAPLNGLPADGPVVPQTLRHAPEGYVPPPNTIVMRETTQTRGLHTIIRDKNTSSRDCLFYSDRLTRLLIEEALSYLPAEEVDVETRVGDTYHGVKWTRDLCGVSILRAGAAFESSLRAVLLDCVIGKILIQRDEETAEPQLFYAKLPEDIADRTVLLLDPMLATGGSAIAAIKVLISAGVPEESIMFINLIACPEGLAALYAAYPKVSVITAEVDRELLAPGGVPGTEGNPACWLFPGIGDYGDLVFLGGGQGMDLADLKAKNNKQ